MQTCSEQNVFSHSNKGFKSMAEKMEESFFYIFTVCVLVIQEMQNWSLVRPNNWQLLLSLCQVKAVWTCPTWVYSWAPPHLLTVAPLVLLFSLPAPSIWQQSQHASPSQTPQEQLLVYCACGRFSPWKTKEEEAWMTQSAGENMLGRMERRGRRARQTETRKRLNMRLLT